MPVQCSDAGYLQGNQRRGISRYIREDFLPHYDKEFTSGVTVITRAARKEGIGQQFKAENHQGDSMVSGAITMRKHCFE